MNDYWHCPNGHLLVSNTKGLRGCLKPGCVYRLAGNVPEKKPKKKGK